eukprot:gene24638-10595_t
MSAPPKKSRAIAMDSDSDDELAALRQSPIKQKSPSKSPAAKEQKRPSPKKGTSKKAAP